MRVGNTHYRTIWTEGDAPEEALIIDQRKLPFSFEVIPLRTVGDTAIAISDMAVRGAGLIGATAGYGMWLAAREAKSLEELKHFGDQLKATRPTATNLAWAVDRQLAQLSKLNDLEAIRASALEEATAIANEDAEFCRRIGEHGKTLIEDIAAQKPAGSPVNILTHCNAGWLAFVDHGSATAPIYAAHDAGIPVHVWVDETRPRNQGARLTAWELHSHGVPHTVIADNVGGHLMQHGMVDLVITGTDRTTHTGDVANKIGTYLKALAAKDNEVPFYVALPSSTFDWKMRDGVAEIPIEQRGADEVAKIGGVLPNAPTEEIEVSIISPGSSTANYAFDVTPSRLISGLITERGICKASEEGVRTLFPEKATP